MSLCWIPKEVSLFTPFNIQISVFDRKIKTNPQEMGDCLIYNPGKQKVKDYSKAVSRNSDLLYSIWIFFFSPNRFIQLKGWVFSVWNVGTTIKRYIYFNAIATWSVSQTATDLSAFTCILADIFWSCTGATQRLTFVTLATWNRHECRLLVMFSFPAEVWVAPLSSSNLMTALVQT